MYVGKHSATSLDNSYMGSGVAIKNAIIKYGLSNFKKDIICTCTNEASLNESEIFWIDRLGVFKKGYNMTKGGEGTLGHVKTKDSIAKQSASMLKYYADNPEARNVISKRAKLRVGDKNPFFGKKLSKDHIENMKIARCKAISGDKNKSAVKVRCVETNRIFTTATDAAKSCNLKYPTTILKAAKGTLKSAGGFKWELV